MVLDRQGSGVYCGQLALIDDAGSCDAHSHGAGQILSQRGEGGNDIVTPACSRCWQLGTSLHLLACHYRSSNLGAANVKGKNRSVKGFGHGRSPPRGLTMSLEIG